MTTAAKSVRGSLWTMLGHFAWRPMVLFSVGCALLYALYEAADSGPFAAMREALLSAHLRASAYSSAPKMPVAVRMIVFDEDYCNRRDGTPFANCQPAGPINRAEIARILRLAERSNPRAILLDFGPYARSHCDDTTLALIQAVIDVSKQSPVILPRELIGEGELRQDGIQFFDQCESKLSATDLSALRSGSRVFFGHADLQSSRPEVAIDSIRPWLVADIGPIPKRRRIPAVSLVAALAAGPRTAQELFQVLQLNGLETRWRSDSAHEVSQAKLEFCLEARRDGCLLSDVHLWSLPQPWRLSFPIGWETTSALSQQQLERVNVLTHISALHFDEERAMALGREGHIPHILIIGATAPAYGDVHRTVMGLMPGAVIHAEAIFDFVVDGFIQVEASRISFWKDVKSLLLFTLYTSAIALVVCSLPILFRMRTFICAEGNEWSVGDAWPLKRVWPLTLFVMAAYKLYSIWASMHQEFSEGLFSYTFLAMFVAGAHLFAVVEEGTGKVFQKVVDRTSEV